MKTDYDVPAPAKPEFPLLVEHWRQGGCIRCGEPRRRHARFFCWPCLDATTVSQEDFSYVLHHYGNEDDDK